MIGGAKLQYWQTKLKELEEKLKTDPSNTKLIKDIQKAREKIDERSNSNKDVKDDQDKKVKDVSSVITRKVKKTDKKSNKDHYVCEDEYKLDNNELITVLQESVKKYYEHGGRSNEKLNILHFYINCAISYALRKNKYIDETIMENIEIRSVPFGETRATGYIYDKYIDISVKYKNKVIGIVSVKFIMSNYAQNANNYLENTLGETFNLKYKFNNRVYWHCIFSFKNIPKYNNKNEKEGKTENIDIKNYQKIHKDKNPTLPDYVSITKIDNDIEDVIHPNKKEGDNDVERIVKNIFKKDKLVHNNRTMNFYGVLNNFVRDVVNKIILPEQSETAKTSKVSKTLKTVKNAKSL